MRKLLSQIKVDRNSRRNVVGRDHLPAGDIKAKPFHDQDSLRPRLKLTMGAQHTTEDSQVTSCSQGIDGRSGRTLVEVNTASAIPVW